MRATNQRRLTQLSNLDPASANLATYAYTYDHDWAAGTDTMLGQRTSMAATVPSQGFSGEATKYYYDPLYQLTRVDYPNVAPLNGEVHSWTYDAIGNRLTNTVNSTALNYTYAHIGANPLNWQMPSLGSVLVYGYNGLTARPLPVEWLACIVRGNGRGAVFRDDAARR